ncbi:hypothetical protein [Blastococcus sp. URHD0036]|uniref:hypothetical protein n=1 Tax=Blastococcus sp. URHD0036 TaxID=1380356 RepID=UPI0004951EE9|nr:hypothetical protein [Blastococcus sp. URHD0036]
MLIALCSAKGAPGVTTTGLALALSWPRPVVLAELDPAGGDVLAGYGRGETPADGLAEIEFAARRGDLIRHLDARLLRLDGDGQARLLPGLADPAGAGHVNWDRLASSLAGLDGGTTDVLADCGRLRTEHFPTAVLERAAAVVLVTGSSLRAVRAATHAIAELRARTGGAGLLAAVVVRPGEPYSEPEIGEALGVPVIGSLPRDVKAAAVLSDGIPAGRLYSQSALMRTARTLATEVIRVVEAHRSRLAPPPDATSPSTITVGDSRVG